MATKTDGERALADLEAGKFSFEMVDAIRAHVTYLETELQRAGTEMERVSALHDGAANELRQQEYKVLRLEAELRALNARVYALLKANALTQTALGVAKRGAVSVVEYLPVARNYAEAGLKQTLAYLATVDFKGKFEELKAHPMTETALREIERLAVKFVEYLPVARMHAEKGSKQALAYLSTVDFKGRFEELKAHPMTEKARAWLANLDVPAEWTKLKTHPLPKKALSELQPVLLHAREYLPVAQKRIAALVEKATAYIAQLQKKAA